MKQLIEKKSVLLLLIVSMLIFSQSLVYIEISNHDFINNKNQLKLKFSSVRNPVYLSNYIYDADSNNSWSKPALKDDLWIGSSTLMVPQRDFLLMIMIGLPVLFIVLLSIYYIIKYYIKKKINPSKIKEIKKRAMMKKKKKSLSLADEYIAMILSKPNEHMDEISEISIDAESQTIATPSSTEDQVEASPIIETTTISIICPICKANKKVIIPKSIVDEAKQLTAVSIAKDIVCEHHFQAFVDKNLIIRGYQKVDYHL